MRVIPVTIILFITFVDKFEYKIMLRIKRLYTFVYQTFLPIFAMTFGICLFIFIIQLLWQHIDKLIGKGLDTMVIVEFFTYASIMLISQVLPLAILLASLMTFGNMGERLELVAIKASGVSLMKIMRPMIILICAITLGSFYFQNKIGPAMNVKFYSLLYSIRQKSPELAIPEGSFYNEISGYSIYVKKKDLDTHMLHGVVIYDTSKGFSNMSVDVCDSAMMKVADSKDYLTLTMYNGESFSNLRKDTRRAANTGSEFVPYVREHFTTKEVIIPFNDDFERIDESRYDSHQLSKNLKQLEVSIDSMKVRVDSLNTLDRKTVLGQPVFSHRINHNPSDTAATKEMEEKRMASLVVKSYNLDSVFDSYALHEKNEIMSAASSDARSLLSNHLTFFHIEMPKPQLQKNMRLHTIFWHKMFSVPFACLVFFFIGAPLGAIIRKGGLGVPVIISVLFYLIYYIIGNIGYKMARDGVWAEWQGEWLSTAVLLPLGVFLTYKSTRESSLFNAELYGKYIRKILRIKELPSKSKLQSEVALVIPKPEELTSDVKLIADYRELRDEELRDISINYVAYKLEDDKRYLALSVLFERGVDVGRLMSDDNNAVKEVLSHAFDTSSYYTMFAYVVTLVCLITIGFTPFYLLEISYFILFLRCLIYYTMFYTDGEAKRSKVKYYSYHTLVLLLAFLAYPIVYFYIQHKMSKDVGKSKAMR